MASRGVNKVILIGNLGIDPEVRYTPSGSAVANISLATSEAWREKQSGELQERTEWHRVVFFNRLAEIVGEYLRKGSKVYVEGSLRTRKWTDKAGVERYTTEIIADEMHILDSKSGGGHANYEKASGPAPQQSHNNNHNNHDTFSSTEDSALHLDTSNDDDDIPF